MEKTFMYSLQNSGILRNHVVDCKSSLQQNFLSLSKILPASHRLWGTNLRVSSCPIPCSGGCTTSFRYCKIFFLMLTVCAHTTYLYTHNTKCLSYHLWERPSFSLFFLEVKFHIWIAYWRSLACRYCMYRSEETFVIAKGREWVSLGPTAAKRPIVPTM